MEDSVFEADKGLRAEAKDTLGMILDSLQSTNPDEMSYQTKAQLQTLAAQSGIPFEVLTQALKTQYQRQVYEDSIENEKLKFTDIQNILKLRSNELAYYLKDMEKRLIKKYRTPIPAMSGLDSKIGGGLAGGELGIILSPTGGGKSMMLVKFACTALKAGKQMSFAM